MNFSTGMNYKQNQIQHKQLGKDSENRAFVRRIRHP